MIRKKYLLGRGSIALLWFVFLVSCVSSPNTRPQIDGNGQNTMAPSNTPFQPVMNTPTSSSGGGILPSVTSELASPAPTNASDQQAPASLTPPVATLSSNNPTSTPASIPPDDPTSPAPPLANPTITPDIPTPPPPGDPSIAVVPYNTTAGGILQISLGDFGANENVTMQIHLGTNLNNLQDSFVVTVNGDGDLTFNWTVPQHYAVGNYSILATGQTYGKTITGYFRVR